MLKKVNLLLPALAAAASVSIAFAKTPGEETIIPVRSESFIAQKLSAARAAEEEKLKDFVWRKHSGKTLVENEKLVFDVKWQFVAVGEATLELRGVEEIGGRQAYHIYSEAKTKPFFDEFFKIRDVNQSWIDKESMAALKFDSNISEGGWKKREETFFDQKRGTYLLYDNGKMQMGTIPEYVQDVFTSLYYLRTFDLKVGAEYVFDAHSGDSSWPLVVKVLKKEKIKTPAGKFGCFVVEPLLRENSGIFNAKGSIQVWLTADDRKMPVYMTSKIPIGSINAVLTKYE